MTREVSIEVVFFTQLLTAHKNQQQMSILHSVHSRFSNDEQLFYTVSIDFSTIFLVNALYSMNINQISRKNTVIFSDKNAAKMFVKLRICLCNFQSRGKYGFSVHYRAHKWRGR